MNEELRSEISRLLTDALSDEGRDGHRSDLFDRYMGEPYGDEVEGRSKFVDTTVSDAVEAVFTDVMDVYSSQEQLVTFNAVGAEDEDAASQETDACHHIWEQCGGFTVLSTWIKEALIQQNSYVWSGWIEKERVEIEEYEDLTIDELVQVVSQLDGEYEFLEQEGFEEDEFLGPVQAIDEDGQLTPISVKIRCVKTEKKYAILPIPQEDYFGTPRWGSVDLDGIPCCGWKREMRRPELIAMGFDEASIDEAIGADDEAEKDNRHSTQDNHESEADDTDVVTLYEAYMVLEVDGREGLYRVYTGAENGEPLKWANGKDCVDEVSRRRISCLTPLIIPHRHIGRSVSERVDDIQQVNTVLTRHTLDNLYATNYGRPYFDENLASPHTYQDLQNTQHGAPVRTGGADIKWYTPPSIVGTVLPLLEKFSALKEERVGATRYNQGLDAESLNKTVGGMAMILNSSQKKNKLIARTFAETGIRDVFLRMHADLRAGPFKSLAMKLRGKWVNVDPRTWKHRTDMTVAVGMGKGDAEMVRAGLMNIGNIQRELFGNSPMVGEAEIYNTVKAGAKTFGIDHVDPFIKDPATIPPQPPQPEPPNPIMISAQLEQAKIAADAEAKARKDALDHEYRMRQLDLREAEVANKIQTDDEEQSFKRADALRKDDLERDLAFNANTPENQPAQN